MNDKRPMFIHEEQIQSMRADVLNLCRVKHPEVIGDELFIGYRLMCFSVRWMKSVHMPDYIM